MWPSLSPLVIQRHSPNPTGTPPKRTAQALLDGLRANEPESMAKLTKLTRPLWEASGAQPAQGTQAAGAPFRAFLRDPTLLALGATHFANNVFHYTLLCWSVRPAADLSDSAEDAHLSSSAIAPHPPPAV